ncbi:MAG: endonuclease domain-containing protein [Sulfuritalea sp.]|nr:endonuclease domain-containing protein [Sulfuritalea sp.]
MSRTQFARKLRHNLTDAERKLWSRMSAHQLGAHFRRQAPLGSYVLDFACFAARVVVEVDGGQHADSEKDRVRDAWLKAQGFKVLRFWNNEVLQNIDGVLETIVAELNKALPRQPKAPPPRPSPMKGEGENRLAPPAPSPLMGDDRSAPPAPSPLVGEGWGGGK